MTMAQSKYAEQDSMNSPNWLPPVRQPFMPDDHSKVEPLLPIPNRTVKRLRADDSADSRVKVGHRQALTAPNTPTPSTWEWGYWFVYKCEGLVRQVHKIAEQVDRG